MTLLITTSLIMIVLITLNTGDTTYNYITLNGITLNDITLNDINLNDITYNDISN